MGGGLMQLVAYGAQDVYLTGNPQITFFKVVYRRHTNFAMETIEQTFNGTPGTGKRVTAIISRNGDLIHKMYLKVVLPRAAVTGGTGGDVRFHWTNRVGLALVKSAELEIGGQRIDKHYGDWMNIWNELSLSESKAMGYDRMVGGARADDGVMSYAAGREGVSATYVAADTAGLLPEVTLNIPFEFWFCRNPGLALPLIALQYHEVKLNIEFNEANCLSFTVNSRADAVTSAATVALNGGTAATGTTLAAAAVESLNTTVAFASDPTLWVDYVYLDTDERRKFAQVSHEYLIEQLQYTGEETKTGTNAAMRLNFNHPIKELVWVAQPALNVANKAVGQFDYQLYPTTHSGQAITDAGASGANMIASKYGNLTLNTGTDAGVTGSGDDQAVRTFLNVQAAVLSDTGRIKPFNPVKSGVLQLNGHERFKEREGEYFNQVQPMQHHERVPMDKGINVYSFGLKPEEHQPSGTANFSRIDTATLTLNFHASATYNVRIYAVNYNVLRIMSGMGGLAYSN
jgi:hypothetical protein